jgi:predicted phosphohydrolase
MSDTHTYGRLLDVPEGDVLLHAGDLTLRGTQAETKAALTWVASLPHAVKLFCAGNHDWFFDENAPRRFRSWSLYHHYSVEQMHSQFPGVTYLKDASLNVGGLTFYGTPWQPAFEDWAFNLPRDDRKLVEKWSRIPTDTGVLVVHGPPMGILDRTTSGEHVGCALLAERLAELHSLRLCVFGHVHESYGVEHRSGVTFVNASICDADYKPVNTPIVVDVA